jgi:hypothetical protein
MRVTTFPGISYHFGVDDHPQFPASPPTEGVASAPPPTPAAPSASPSVAALEAQERRARRPHPRLGTTVAGAGCAVAFFGTLTVSGDALDGGDGDGSQLPGVVLCLLLLVGGMLLLARATSSTYRTAGSFVAALAVPPLVFFLTFDRDGFPPYSTEAILFLSSMSWLGMHLWGPAVGRTFPLGAGLVAAWLFLLQLLERPFTAPFDFLEFLFDESSASILDEDTAPFGGFDGPDITTMGIVSLLIGVALSYVGLRLHRAGQHGRATGFAAAAVIVLPFAVLLLASDLEEIGTGVLLLVLGAGLAIAGPAQGRRFTSWLGGFSIFWGTSLIVAELVGGDSASGLGVAFMVAGAAVVVGGHHLAKALDEPGELVAAPSPFPGSPSSEESSIELRAPGRRSRWRCRRCRPTPR